MSHRKYKTLEENKTLFLLVLKGKKRWPLPFQKPKNWAAEKRTSSKRWGRKWHKTTVEKEKEKLTEFLGGTTRVPALLYGESPLSLGEINLNQYEVLFFEPLHCYLNQISYVLKELPHHITDVDTLMTLKETLSIALKKKQAPLQRLFSSTSLGHHSLKWKIRQQCNGLLTTLAEKVGIFYAKEDTRYLKQILPLANLSFKHALAMRAILTPSKTMTIRKLYLPVSHTRRRYHCRRKYSQHSRTGNYKVGKEVTW